MRKMSVLDFLNDVVFKSRLLFFVHTYETIFGATLLFSVIPSYETLSFKPKDPRNMVSFSFQNLPSRQNANRKSSQQDLSDRTHT